MKKSNKMFLNPYLKTLLLCFVFGFTVQYVKSQQYNVSSPNGNLSVSVVASPTLQYSVAYHNTAILSSSTIAMSFDNNVVAGVNGVVANTETRTVDEVIPVLFGKNKSLADNFNELRINYTENYSVVFRVYNDGVAYRFVTNFPQQTVIVNSENAICNFTSTPGVYFPEATTLNHWEKSYTTYASVNDLGESQFAVIPILFNISGTNYKVVLTEADNNDYPGLYIQKNGPNSVKGMWAQYPDVVDQPDNIYSNHEPITRFNYLAVTTGARNYPWRVFVFSADDKELLNNELVYKLAEPQKAIDFSWVTAGKSSWEWWHKAMLEGVSFPVGNDNLGLTLYEYYIDFAAQNHIEYMTLDAGWSESYISALCAYAKTKGVKIIVWTWASNALQTPNWIAKMKRYGISGVKIDFFQRNDQIAMGWGLKLAQDLANNKMVGIFHGCPVPTGLNRTYPNILNFEAVLGNEENFWRRGSDPNYHVQFPFIRSLAGPEDYTPGSMRNKTQRQFTPVDLPNTVPSSQGTRCHELSMFVVFDQWLGYLCDAPTEYAKYPDILEFLSKVPSVWGKTVPLDARLGEYIVMAKEKDAVWYVGGMSSWNAKDVSVNFDFLPVGKKYRAYILKDDITSGDYPTRYVYEEVNVTSASSLAFSMAKGGGFVIRLVEEVASGITKLSASSPVDVFFDKSTREVRLSSADKILSVDVYNISGQLVLANSFSSDEVYTKRIGLSGLKAGVYLVRVQTYNGAVNTLKLINC